MTHCGRVEGNSIAKERPLKRRWFFVLLVASIAFLGTETRVNAEPFKSAKECLPGMHVTDHMGKSGRVIGINRNSASMCDVTMDGTGQIGYYLFWMLHAAGGSAETNDKLVPGKYECFAGGRYTFMDMYITGPSTYSSAGTSGSFSVLASRKIVFHGGSLAPYYAHLLDGPRIGLNTDGGSFYATTCELKKR